VRHRTDMTPRVSHARTQPRARARRLPEAAPWPHTLIVTASGLRTQANDWQRQRHPPVAVSGHSARKESPS